MKLLFVTPYFPPEVGAAQTRIHELAVCLAKLGHEVAVLTTFPNYPSGIVPLEWRGKFFWKGTDCGLTIYRVWSYAAPNRGFLRRVASHLSFALFAALAVLFLPRHDAMIVESPPLFDGFIGVGASALRRIPYLFMVSDLWPESAVQMGMLRNRFLIWASKRIELLFYRHAAAVLALTTGIRQGIIADGINPAKVLLFRNSVDCDFFRPGISGDAIRAEIGTPPSDFLVLYAGTFGLAQNLSTVLEAAALLQETNERTVHFVLAGDGAESDLLREKAQALGLENVSFVPSMSKARMPELMNAADCVLVPLRDLAIFRGALPTKMFEAMSCGKPVVLGIRGEAEELLRDAGAGYCVAPEVPGAICAAIAALRQDPGEARKMGENGRTHVLQYFSRQARSRELSEALQRVIDVRGQHPTVTCPQPQSTLRGN
ncbi:MAG: glycosyltransferase family 4 protein [Terriglobales bacterium]